MLPRKSRLIISSNGLAACCSRWPLFTESTSAAHSRLGHSIRHNSRNRCRISLTNDDAFLLTSRMRTFSSCAASLKEKVSKRNTGKQKPKIIIDHDELKKLFDVDKFHKTLEKLTIDFRDELVKHFSLRTRIASFDDISVTIGTTKYALNDLAQITFKTPQLVMINMSSMPEHAKAVIDALNKSGMNLNPQLEGNLIFVPLPKISREHREQLAKNAKHALDEAKIKVRNVQNSNLQQVKTMPHVSEDVLFNASQMVMQEADVCMAKLDSLLHQKEQELLQQ